MTRALVVKPLNSGKAEIASPPTYELDCLPRQPLGGPENPLELLQQ